MDGGAPSASDRPFAPPAPPTLEPGEASGEGSDSSAAVFLVDGGPSLLVGVMAKFDAVLMLDMVIECNDDPVVVVMLNDLRDFLTSPESEVLLEVEVEVEVKVDEAGTGTGQ